MCVCVLTCIHVCLCLCELTWGSQRPSGCQAWQQAFYPVTHLCGSTELPVSVTTDILFSTLLADVCLLQVRQAHNSIWMGQSVCFFCAASPFNIPFVTLKMSLFWGWKDGSVSKVLPLHARGPESIPRTLVKSKTNHVAEHTYNPSGEEMDTR